MASSSMTIARARLAHACRFRPNEDHTPEREDLAVAKIACYVERELQRLPLRAEASERLLATVTEHIKAAAL